MLHNYIIFLSLVLAHILLDPFPLNKYTNKITIQSNNFTSGYTHTKIESKDLNRYSHTRIYTRITHNYQ